MRTRTTWSHVFTFVVVVSLTACRSTLAPSASHPEPTTEPGAVSAPPSLSSALSAAKVTQDQVACTSFNSYSPTLRGEAKDARGDLLETLTPYLQDLSSEDTEHLSDLLLDHEFWWMVRIVLLEGQNNNLGGIVLKDHYWTDEDGLRHPVVVFRTGLTPEPDAPGACYRSLLESAHVRHVVNLYDGEIPDDDLIAGEKAVAQAFGATYVRTVEKDYGKWRDELRDHPEASPERDDALERLGRLVRDEILTPGGAPPRGNILVHCGGGMHRTGMVMGILQRAVNDEPMELVEADYLFHVGYESPESPGGLEPGNLEVIQEFDPTLLYQ